MTKTNWLNCDRCRKFAMIVSINMHLMGRPMWSREKYRRTNWNWSVINNEQNNWWKPFENVPKECVFYFWKCLLTYSSYLLLLICYLWRRWQWNSFNWRKKSNLNVPQQVMWSSCLRLSLLQGSQCLSLFVRGI